MKLVSIVSSLSLAYKGVDLVVNVVEEHARLIPLNRDSALRLWFNTFPTQVKEALDNTEIPKEIASQVNQYYREIKRAALSGIWHLDLD